MKTMKSGIDCKGREWEEIPLGRARDLTNQKYNYLKPLFRVKTINPGTWWLCICDCGNYTICRNNAITSGSTVSCGCHKHTACLNDLTGQRFGKLIVLERSNNKWKCQCDCGNIKEVSTGNLTNGTTKSCGCFKKNQLYKNLEKYNLIGQKFGYLTVIERAPCPDNTGKAYYKCLCDCGNETIVQACNLRSGARCSCGNCSNRMSQGELEIKLILDANNIKYLYDKRYFKDLIMSGGGIGRYDFILIDEDEKPYRIIEFDGRQHSDNKSIYYLKQKGQRFQDVEANDIIKNNYALQHKIPLIRIPYTQLRNITYDMIMGDEFLVKE